jgi:hypothetical protein
MDAKLQDLRYLHLACQIEEAFEGLERGLERHLPLHVRRQLEPLFQEGPNHRRLQEAFQEVNRELARHEAEVTARQLVAAIRDCEALAREFYHNNAGKLSDPRLQQIFRGMAAEEGAHLEAAEKALLLVD